MNITCSRHLYFQRLLATWLTGLRASSLARLAAVAVFSLVMLQATAQAAAFTPADEKSVRSVIQAQLAAFAEDDATKAFSYAAPNVRKAIGTASRFLNMVQNDYPVVYRPASVAFLKAEGDGDDVVQRVQMQDAEGNAWLAIYSLQRQKGNLWRITGCALTENKGRMV